MCNYGKLLSRALCEISPSFLFRSLRKLFSSFSTLLLTSVFIRASIRAGMVQSVEYLFFIKMAGRLFEGGAVTKGA